MFDTLSPSKAAQSFVRTSIIPRDAIKGIERESLQRRDTQSKHLSPQDLMIHFELKMSKIGKCIWFILDLHFAGKRFPITSIVDWIKFKPFLKIPKFSTFLYICGNINEKKVITQHLFSKKCITQSEQFLELKLT